MNVVLHLLMYMKGIPNLGIFFNNIPDLTLATNCDSYWASCPESRRSVTSYCVLLGGSLVSWKGMKQHIVSRSSAKAEYRAMSKAVVNLTWLSRFQLILTFFILLLCLYFMTVKLPNILLGILSSMRNLNISN